MADKTCLLAVGIAKEGYGFGRVLRSLLFRLMEDYEVHQLELVISQSESESVPWQVYERNTATDRFGLEQLHQLIKQTNPSILFVVGELWVLPYYAQFVQEYKPSLKLVTYSPVDGKLSNYRYFERLASISRLVVYNEFARQEILRVIADLPPRALPDNCLPLSIIPHGIDHSLFYSLGHLLDPQRRRYAREELGRRGLGNGVLADDFIILNANRNTRRKSIQTTIEAFSLFASNKPPNVKLWLHMGIIDSGINVIGWARKFGITERLLLTTTDRNHPQVSDQIVNLIYNACDVGLNTSGGEGWGLVSFEHAATGAAQIVPRHTACQELWQGSALMVDSIPAMAVEQSDYVQFQTVSVQSVAEALEKLYQDPNLLQSMTIAAQENTKMSERQWDSVASQFNQLFQDVLKE